MKYVSTSLEYKFSFILFVQVSRTHKTDECSYQTGKFFASIILQLYQIARRSNKQKATSKLVLAQ
jgi:hypothetical protein